ncbi:MAG: hypothetical protein ACREBU_26300, partial [Nitrososphaera sp.]
MSNADSLVFPKPTSFDYFSNLLASPESPTKITSHVAEVAGIHLACIVSHIVASVLMLVYARWVPTINTVCIEADFVTKKLLRDHASDDRTGDGAQKAARHQSTESHAAHTGE